ncbi:unnamed protein product [Owenia fusiformis]|uniref:Vang-like protein n=1 Tax=Owenia fusiformis TaxID=6347 RepID=A0A8S4PVT1_OWEFU|nr:unnamed protein product [Owenia fusiformis]
MDSDTGRSERSETSRHRSRGRNRRSRGVESDRDDRSTRQIPEDGTGEERIEVQILPQDDNWGDNTTAITGNTSETGISMENMSERFGKDLDDHIGFDCAKYVGTMFAAVLALFAFLSPVAMVVLPKIGINGWKAENCTCKLEAGTDKCKPIGTEVQCEGLLISLAFKLVILVIGAWALFVRKPRATMPRIFIYRVVILFLVFVLTFAFWLFYGFRIFQTQEKDYHSIILFSVSLVDALLFIHYLTVILLEIRHLQTQYIMKIVRSPDGASMSYTVGQLSIQRLAVWALEQYYKDFEVYNHYLENISKKSQKMPQFKFYDVDGMPSQTPHSKSRAIFAAAARRRDSSHNDRFYEEEEYKRRVQKRRARLLTAAEEAFTHIKRMQGEAGPAIPMDPQEAAQAVFPSMARALQKFLRITRQQPRYTLEGVLEHLANCISNDMSPKAFLERYLTQGAVIYNDREYKSSHNWVLISDSLLSSAVEHGTIFNLRQGEVGLMVSIRKLPHFNLTEEVLDPKMNKFVLRLNSETSV